ncbi:MAG: replication-associated recombination protein A [Bacilli bacterium]|jgi:putative ATPase|nr:replication-associated recombination protein A [Bacilli bacterium]
MRPTTLDEVIGQDDVVGKNGFLRKSVEHQSPVSMILFGPPGTGKTTIAEAYARSIDIPYKRLNAVTTDKKEMQEAILDAKLSSHAIVIVDEVHRLDKQKQDLLLPYVEDGTFYLIGATTANPYIALNRAIRSRCRLIEIKPLSEKDVVVGLKRAIASPKGLDNKLNVNDEGLNYIAKLSGGDLRFALNMLEEASIQFDEGKSIGVDELKTIESVPNYAMDKGEEEHYDSVSALQKSIRGADVDAALYYLARLCIAEDLDSIKRRLLVTAYEDIGLGNPPAVQRCQLAIEAAEQVGFPEAIIPLGFTVCELCLSPHSKASTLSIEKTMDFAAKKPFMVQDYLKLTPINLKDEDKYPYDRPDLWEKIQYLPDFLKEMRFYEPNAMSKSSYEKALNENYQRMIKNGRSNKLSELKRK